MESTESSASITSHLKLSLKNEYLTQREREEAEAEHDWVLGKNTSICHIADKQYKPTSGSSTISS